MSPEVEREYHEILARLIAEHGYPVRPPGEWSFYSQHEYDGHTRSCGVVSYGKPQEDTWSEFQGTFADDHTVHGATVTVTCNCGRYVDRTVRWNVRATEMAELIFTALYEKLHGTEDGE